MGTRYILPVRILKLEERFVLVDMTLDDAGEWQRHEVSTGWWAYLDIGVWVSLGPQEPDLKIGLARWSLENEPPRPRDDETRTVNPRSPGGTPGVVEVPSLDQGHGDELYAGVSSEAGSGVSETSPLFPRK